MIIQCTKKVLDKLGIKDADKAPDVAASGLEEMKRMLHSWHVNLLTIDRRNVLLFFNDLACVSVIVYRPKAKDYKRMNKLLLDGVEALTEWLDVAEAVILDVHGADIAHVLYEHADVVVAAVVFDCSYRPVVPAAAAMCIC